MFMLQEENIPYIYFLALSEEFPRHYENTPIQIYRKFHLQKTENFQNKNSYIFHISA